jgi:hypothetical protein
MEPRSILSEPKAPRASPSEQDMSIRRTLRILIRAFIAGCINVLIAGCAAPVQALACAGLAARRAGAW